MKKGKLRKSMMCLGLAAVMFGMQLMGAVPAQRVSADSANTADLRLLFTTDLHGQLTSVDYTTGAIANQFGLAKATTLIQEARNEKGAANTLLFDLGDVMYDYTTDYIYDYDESAIQPIYSAMASLGYDAITLGNHDFEYTLPYIQNQLTGSGLLDKVVVSNVKDANTGASVWNQNKVIEKTLTTKQGQTITVKVGIIGETIPTLSKKRCDYTGVLVGEDIVANVTKETQTLKSQGADIVVVLAHSGVGEENPAAMDENVAYALTKIDGVDAVLSGHKHAYFCADGTTKYDSYPGVDTSTGLVNGKNLVMVANSGKGIGVVDLTVSNASGSNEIVGRKSAIRKVKKNTKADENINNNFMGNWADTFIADSSEILCEMDTNIRLQNYFGTIEDSGAIQLLNDIGISYGMLYQNNENTAYQGLPVVSGAKYLKYGSGSGDDYLDITGNFTRSNLYQLINYRTQLYLYEVTGSQLKEWLEWSASAYETTGENILVTPAPNKPTDTPTESPMETPVDTASGGAFHAGENAAKGISGQVSQRKGIQQKPGLLEGIFSYQGSQPLQQMMKDEWLTDWEHYYIFDGVEYHIDTSKAPRYDYDGNKINDTFRVDKMTRNGQEIKDTDKLILVVNRLLNTPVPSQFNAAYINRASTTYMREYIENYLERESLCGTMKNIQDDNWSVGYSNDYQYLVKTGEGAAELAKTKNWIAELLDSSEDFYYYRADFSKMNTLDTTGPNLNLKSLNDEETNNDVKVAVQATDPSGLYSVKYLLGKYTADSSAWNQATNIDSSFMCTENGIYSVLATDLLGNKTLKYIRINNVNKSILQAPKVKTYTNRHKNIEGTAEPKANIYFELQGGKVYQSTVKADGTFSYALTPQRSGSKVYVYVTDDKGRASARTVVTVKRTGPNKPVLDKVVTSSRIISGELNDSNVYPVFIIDDKKTVYLPNNGTKELYEKSGIYNAKYKVVELEMNIKEDGTYSFAMPSLLPAKTQIKLRTLDAVSRNSMLTSKKVTQVVPAKPIVDEVTNLSKNVKIYSEEKCTSAAVQIGKKEYTVKKAKYVSSKKMYRFTVKIPRSDSGVKLKISLTNVKGKSPILKTTKTEVVPDTPKLNKVKAGVKKITGSVHLVGDKDKSGETTVSSTKTKVFVYVNKKKYKAKVSADGTYKVKVKKIVSGTKITVQARNAKGNSKKRKAAVK